MKEPLDDEPECYDLFLEANRAVEGGGIVFDGNEIDFGDDDDFFDDDLSIEYVSEEDELPEGFTFGEDYSESSSGDVEMHDTEPPPPNVVDEETENYLPDHMGCGTDRCPVCGRY